MDITSIIILLITICFLLKKYTYLFKNLPPGPKGLPFLGYAPFVTTKPYIKLLEVKEKYGDVFSIKMGGNILIFLSSYDAIKTAFIKHSAIFSNRPDFFDFLPDLNASGIIFGGGETWVELRRFSLTKLKNLGFGKSSIEPKIQDELEHLIKKLDECVGTPCNINKFLRLSVTNVICTVMYGQRLGYDSKILQELIEITNDLITSQSFENPGLFLPQFIVKLFGIDNPRTHMENLYKAMQREVAEYKIGNVTASQDSFIEMWMTEMKNKATCSININENQLARVLSGLFIAGSDTTSITLTWAILYLTKYPEVQRKVQQEIDNVIGQDKAPTMSDQKRMPYTEATILEILRIKTITPLGLPHCALEDTHLLDYFVPKGATLLPYMHAIHHDPQIFPQPDMLIPERFLTNDNEVKKVNELMPFSIGRRQCMGESLARMELFLFLTTLLQHFTFKTLNRTEINTDERYAGLVLPIEQDITLHRR